MRRALTFLLILCTLLFWSMSLWTLSARVSGTDFLWCALPAAAGLLMMIGLFASGRIFNPVDRVRRLFSAVLATTLLVVIACACAGAWVHPVLFIVAGVGLLCLPPPSDNFFRQ